MCRWRVDGTVTKSKTIRRKFKIPESSGLQSFIGPHNSTLSVLTTWALNLEAGETASQHLIRDEIQWILCSGQLDFTTDFLSGTLNPGDSLYLPRNTRAAFSARTSVKALAASAEAFFDTDPILVRFQDAWWSERHQIHGRYTYGRDVASLLDKNLDKSSRLAGGITIGFDSGWTSWPPHHHSETMEEVYCYFGMNAKGFGIHVGLGDGGEFAEIVRNGDAVVVPVGYHPTVAAPGTRMQYAWFMGAKKSEADRRAPVVVHPDFAD